MLELNRIAVYTGIPDYVYVEYLEIIREYNGFILGIRVDSEGNLRISSEGQLTCSNPSHNLLIKLE